MNTPQGRAGLTHINSKQRSWKQPGPPLELACLPACLPAAREGGTVLVRTLPFTSKGLHICLSNNSVHVRTLSSSLAWWPPIAGAKTQVVF